MSQDATIDRLWRGRPRSLFVRLTALALVVLAGVSWFGGTFDSAFLSGRSWRNLSRFAVEVTPFPLRDGFDAPGLLGWIGDTLGGHVGEAVGVTVALAVASIVLAGVGGAGASLLAARNLANAEPFADGAREPAGWVRIGWVATTSATRLVLIFLRAIPEYVWAFLLVSILGLGAWPVVLALALHNLGILGKLDAEVIEDLEPEAARAMRGLGASRLQLAVHAVFPAVLNRFLLYLFVRWETAVREATVMGLLGVVSLGWFISDARARLRYDEMVLYVLVGAAIILVGDAVSIAARRWIRVSS
jgi:phosphonate transport system permease protein